jgi:hypothetical protein
MNIEQNIERLKNINGDSVIQNLIAQVNSRYILFNTSEAKENFPPYTIDDDNLSILALYYLEIGSSFAENNDLERARLPMERGATILEHIHCAEANKSELSNYYCLISALSYYVSFQYSKSFILIRKIQTSTIISKLISSFLQRNYTELSAEVEKIIVDKTYEDSFIAENDDEIDGANKIYEITIAKSLNGFVRYFQTGNNSYLVNAKEQLNLIKEISEVKSEPSIWWIIRLLLLISDGFNEASLWNSLGKHFNIESKIVKRYIKSLIYLPPRGIHELFITQRKSLSKVLNAEKTGCIVTIPTSSGKTRIAEIAIMDCLIKDAESKVLYIAPFRSLAFEIENSLEKILSNVGINLSHLYGGSLFSKLDEKIIEESNVIIATPEKSKAILRGNQEIANQIKLIIIDEGHLLGPEKRLIVNEIFYEELRFILEKNGGRFLLLSAVLPNSDELALWLTKSKEAVYKDNWRPSDERLGILGWNGEHVNLEWMNNDEGRPSFNNKFIIRDPLPLKKGQRKVRFFPSNKNEAVASTIYKLRTFGTALIFVGLKDSVFTMAEAYLKCLGHDPVDFNYKNSFDWKAYELACTETYGDTNNWLLYARKGILCHHGGLHIDVRIPLERLMRADNPLVIISTSTLGQGVNLGVSTVVFSTLHQAGSPVTPRDFWNIAGRSGRAFVDNEGKVLVAIDISDQSYLFKYISDIQETLPQLYKSKKNKIIDEQREAIKKYFDKEKIDVATSGILALLRDLKQITAEDEISFDVLLQLISENKIEEIGENAKAIDDILDWIDDTLLALQDLNNPSDSDTDYSWIETFFRNSLAYIQIKNEDTLSQENLISFVKSRIQGVVKKVGDDRNKWKSIIKSGIPLNSDLFIENKLAEIIPAINTFFESGNTLESKIELTKTIIKIIDKIPVLIEEEKELESTDLNVLITNWIKAESFSSLLQYSRAEDIISKLFSYKLPWLLNGIAKKIRNINLENEAEIVEEISMLLEIGLPSLKSVKIYQAGIRSRVAAKELSEFFEDELWDKSIKEYKFDIISNRDFYKSKVSKICLDWIDLLFHLSNSRVHNIDLISDFEFGKIHEKTKVLVAKEINGKQYLVSPDFTFVHLITGSDIDFSSINKVSGIFFEYDSEDNLWKMVVENPYVNFN